MGTEEVEMTPAEQEAVAALSRGTVLTGAQRAAVEEIVRAEIASLAGKALRRLQDENFSRSFTRNEATDAAKQVAGHFWGEVLAEYGSDS